MPTVRISRELILETMQSEAVRRALVVKAEAIAAEVQDEAEREGFYQDVSDRYDEPIPDLEVFVREGTRPGGRPYGRVEVDKVDEWGDYAKPKRRILGRLAAKYNTPRRG